MVHDRSMDKHISVPNLEASLPAVPAADTSSAEIGDTGKVWQVVASTDRHRKLLAHVVIGDGCFRCFNRSCIVALVSDVPPLRVRYFQKGSNLEVSLPEVPAADTSSAAIGDKSKAHWQVMCHHSVSCYMKFVQYLLQYFPEQW